MTKQMNIVIAGATSALGMNLAKTLAKNPANKLILLSRTFNETLQNLCNENINYLSGIDLTLLRKDDEIAKKCEAFFDGPFSLIHCAGDFWTHVSFLNFSPEQAKRMMESHYLTLYATLQSLLPVMIGKRGGKILAFSFNSQDDNFPFILPFNAAKAAVEATIKCIGHEYAQHGIAANVLSLASFKTEASRKSRPFGDFENYLELSEISQTVLDVLDMNGNLVNASVINCYKYSETYYNQGYFERIKHL